MSGNPRQHLRPTQEQCEQFLDRIQEGKTRQEAAEAVGSTATQFRTFINGKGEDSLAFAERYLAALTDAGKTPSPFAAKIREAEGVQLAHRLLDETIMRALDPERGKVGASNRLLHNLNLLKLEDFKPLLEARTRHIHEGQVGLYAAQPQLDTSRLTLDEHKELISLEHRRWELIAKAAPDGVKLPQAALGNGNGSQPEIVEDAEFVEVDDAG